MAIDQETLSLLEQLAPDLMKKLTLRATVLERISALQPVGRRALAHRLHMPEREIRSVCDTLKVDGLISVGASGMSITSCAADLLPLSRAMSQRRSAISQLEQHLARSLNVVRVCIVPGDADEEILSIRSGTQYASSVLQEVGHTAAAQLLRLLAPDMILAVSGGKLLNAAAAALSNSAPVGKTNLRVVPARGITPSDIGLQADTVASLFAHALGGTHFSLPLPDAAPAEALRELLKLPRIAQTIQLLSQTDVLIYSVERAETAARLQGLSENEISRLIRAGAVGEAVGGYFNAAGRMLHLPSAAGLTAEQLSKINCIAAVAAGASQARALLSVLRHHRHELLVLDEGAARALEKLL